MSRRATIRTSHDDPELVAAAIAPDDTDEMETAVTDGDVVTRIRRETTGGLHATVDDYLVNLDVATRVAANADAIDDADGTEQRDDDGGTQRRDDADGSIETDERSDAANTTETHDDTNE